MCHRDMKIIFVSSVMVKKFLDCNIVCMHLDCIIVYMQDVSIMYVIVRMFYICCVSIVYIIM